MNKKIEAFLKKIKKAREGGIEEVLVIYKNKNKNPAIHNLKNWQKVCQEFLQEKEETIIFETHGGLLCIKPSEFEEICPLGKSII